jgi:UDP-glucuronate decarboxylase
MSSSEVKVEDHQRIFHQVPNLQELRGTKILVTGCTGFIPGALTDFLIYLNSAHNFGIEITGLCRTEKKAKQKFGDRIKIDCAEKIKDYPFDRKYDVVFHAASPASRISFAHTDDLLQTNVVATQKIIDNECAKMLIYFSSGEVYGGDSQTPSEETRILNIFPEKTSSSYAIFKMAGEHLCALSFARKKDIKVARIFHTYGHGISLYDGRIQSDLIGDAVNRKDLVLQSDGEAKRSFCYISDTIAALLFLTLCAKDELVFNVGNSEQVHKIKDFGSTLGQIAKLKFQAGASTDTNRFVGSFSAPNTDKLKSLGWRPQVELREGLIRTLRGFNVPL